MHLAYDPLHSCNIVMKSSPPALQIQQTSSMSYHIELAVQSVLSHAICQRPTIADMQNFDTLHHSVAGVSPAFSAVRMRDACNVVSECALQLVHLIAARPQEPRNIDNLLLRESMDVIGEHCGLTHALN